jgi:hypothetical protein
VLFVGVLCGSDLFTGVCVCVLLCFVFSYALLSYVHIASLVSVCESAGYTSVMCCV